MFLTLLYSSLRRKSGSFPRKNTSWIRHSWFLPCLEALEDRLTPANFTVDRLTDTNPPGDGGAGATTRGDLRYCVHEANLWFPDAANTISFQKGMKGTISLVAPLEDIKRDLTVRNPGSPGDIVVSRSANAETGFRIFTILKIIMSNFSHSR